jgi:hypothetical protein
MPCRVVGLFRAGRGRVATGDKLLPGPSFLPSEPTAATCCRELPSAAALTILPPLTSPHPEIGLTTEPTINQHAQITDSIVWVIYG